MQRMRAMRVNRPSGRSIATGALESARCRIHRERKVPVSPRKRVARRAILQSGADWLLQDQLDVALSEPCLARSSSGS